MTEGFAALIVAALVAYVGVLLVGAVLQAHDALRTARAATAGRDASAARFEAKINGLDSRIAQLTAQTRRADRQRGRLQAEVRGLSAQLAALGVTPVFAAPQPTSRPPRPQPHPTATVTRTARPRPSHHPTSSPKPSPTCLVKIATICLPT